MTEGQKLFQEIYNYQLEHAKYVLVRDICNACKNSVPKLKALALCEAYISKFESPVLEEYNSAIQKQLEESRGNDSEDFVVILNNDKALTENEIINRELNLFETNSSKMRTKLKAIAPEEYENYINKYPLNFSFSNDAKLSLLSEITSMQTSIQEIDSTKFTGVNGVTFRLYETLKQYINEVV